MSSREVFYDSNVLLYLLSPDISTSRMLDRYLIDGGVISVQVLNEFVNVGRRKRGLIVPQLRPFLDAIKAALEVVPVTAATHELGLDLIERYKFSTYDAMILSAAMQSGCSVVLSEDMQHGMKVLDRVTIRNPFRQ